MHRLNERRLPENASKNAGLARRIANLFSRPNTRIPNGVALLPEADTTRDRLFLANSKPRDQIPGVVQKLTPERNVEELLQPFGVGIDGLPSWLRDELIYACDDTHGTAQQMRLNRMFDDLTTLNKADHQRNLEQLGIDRSQPSQKPMDFVIDVTSVIKYIGDLQKNLSPADFRHMLKTLSQDNPEIKYNVVSAGREKHAPWAKVPRALKAARKTAQLNQHGLAEVKAATTSARTTTGAGR